MPDHTIHVVNNFGRKRKYAIIPGPPMMTFPDNKQEIKPSQGVGTTAQKPNFGVKVASVDVKDADPGTPTTPASTFGLTKNEKGNPVMTEKENTAPMDMVRFDFSGDLSPSNDKHIVFGMAKGNRLPDNGVGKRPFAYYPAPSDTNAVKFAIMAPVIQLWVCAYDAEEGEIVDFTKAIQHAGLLRFLNTDGALLANVERKQDGTFEITYS
ncbi:hypothetical protein M752DRAFT_292838 [Aspergillus phoenicis ATCC 13157]|uniref:Uncharacterized protein n=1 Tax=Aspergillus phoenicis ATCC 13157 TaxID=1353007 RepID=A0A370PKC8_ASPPH|nr:hypothetical protein M752DRAFT_292838 [Aspergillus phoenicis ATCC 13157]